jgi:hypothetical protein
VDQVRATGVPDRGHAEWKTPDIYPGNVSRITKQLAKQLDGIELVRLRRETRDQKLCFSSRPFVLCGLPFRPLPKTQLLYERRNGRFVLQIAGHPDYGVPFGQDRLVPIFLATLAIQQKTPTIRFKTAAEMLDIFGMSKGGREYRRLIAAFERIFGATIFFGTDTLTSKSSVVKRTRFNFFSEAQIWYHGTKEGRSLSEGEFENVIVLSTEFYEEVIAHPIPTDFEVVRILSSAPAILDLFVWLSYRCFTARGKESIPIFGDFGLVQQIGTTEYTRPRRFRQKLDQWLGTIRLLWPECPATISSDGLYLVIDHATAVLSREQSAHF